MEFYERVSGARMHAAYVRPGGVALVISNLMLFWPEKRVLVLVIWQAIFHTNKQNKGCKIQQNTNTVLSQVFFFITSRHLCCLILPETKKNNMFLRHFFLENISGGRLFICNFFE